MKKPAARAIFRAVTNPLKNKSLVRGAWGVGLWALAACGAKPEGVEPRAPAPAEPLPTSGLAGQQVVILPLTLVAAEDSLHWEAALADRRATLSRCDSILDALLKARAPEVSWVLPDELRRAARRAPGIAPDPDQMGTALLRAVNISTVPDPLRSQLRTLTALAGAGGGRFALVPAALVFRRTGGQAAGRTGYGAVRERPEGRAELSVVLVDVRTGKVGWRTMAWGDGDDPWAALTRAVKGLTPGLP